MNNTPNENGKLQEQTLSDSNSDTTLFQNYPLEKSLLIPLSLCHIQ